MQKTQSMTTRSIMSIEEYMKKRKKMQQKEKREKGMKEEESPAWMVAELYG